MIPITRPKGSLSGISTTHVSQTAYGVFGLPHYYVRGKNFWRVRAYNNRLQPSETYEATNDSAISFLFIS